MKKIVVLLITLFFNFTELFGQFRSDFIIVPRGSRPQLALDDASNINLAWIDDNVSYGLFDSLGQPVHDIAQFNRPCVSRLPMIAVNGQHASVIWAIDGCPTHQRFITGELITKNNLPTSVSIDLGDNSHGAITGDVVFLNSCTFYVSWIGTHIGASMPFTAVYGTVLTTSSSHVDSTLLINGDTNLEVSRFLVRVSSHPQSDHVLVVWRDDLSSSNHNLYGRLLTQNGKPLTSSFLLRDVSDSSEIWGLAVNMNPDSSFKVVWGEGLLGQEEQIFIRTFHPSGEPVRGSERINENTAVIAAAVDIFTDEDGTYLVVWEGLENDKSKIYAQRFDEDGKAIGKNFRISTSKHSSDEFSPTVVVRNKKIYSAWGSNGSIWANILSFENPVTNIEIALDNIPEQFLLFQNYPNPFNPKTKIRYQLKQKANIKIVIYDLIGKEVMILENGEIEAGTYETTWDGKNMEGGDAASGVYLYKLRVDGSTQTRKMLLLK